MESRICSKMKSCSKSLGGDARVLAPPATMIISGRATALCCKNFCTVRWMRWSKQQSTAAPVTYGSGDESKSKTLRIGEHYFQIRPKSVWLPASKILEERLAILPRQQRVS